MLFARSVKVLLLFAAVLLWLEKALAQLVVYEDSASYSGIVYGTTNEFGDEIILDGNARVLTRIVFEYRGDSPAGTATGHLRIYDRTGPPWLGLPDFATPAPLLWESPEFSVDPGFHTKEIPIPSIRVPKRFSWTVKFTGNAGLLLYNLPSYGSGFNNDFWENRNSIWLPVRAPGVLNNNFGAYLLAIPDATLPRLTAGFFGKYYLLSWPVTDTPYILQGKVSLTNQFTDITAPPTRIGDTWQRVLEFGRVGIFRLRQTAPRAPGFLEIIRSNNTVRLRWPAAATGYILQNRSFLTTSDWRDIRTPAAPSTNGFFEITRSAGTITEIFRLRESAVAATLEITPLAAGVRVRWPESARNYILQSKSAAGAWTNEPAPVTTVEGYFQAIVPADSDNKIFRLLQ